MKTIVMTKNRGCDMPHLFFFTTKQWNWYTSGGCIFKDVSKKFLHFSGN
jgi:hypothetical protein